MEKVKHKRKEGVIVGYRNNQLATIDSREVAEMLGKEHSELLKEIEGRKDNKNVGIIPTLEKGNFHLSNYFIPSTYRAGTREYKCYLVTKMGCELLGNKQQGEKGILFTARYVERFNEMEAELNKQDNIYPPLTSELHSILILGSRVNQIETNANERINKFYDDIDKLMFSINEFKKQILITIEDTLNKKLEDLRNNCNINILSNYIYKRLGQLGTEEEYEQVKVRTFLLLNLNTWEDLSVEDYKLALKVIDESIKIVKSERT